jgi:hypothetical protein
VSQKKLGIIQSNYIPWKGYFDIINSVDEFILYDDAQYSKGSWRNRNQIKTAQGLKWLTVPVALRSNLGIKIRDVKIADSQWAKKHWGSLVTNYSAAPYFSEFGPLIHSIYEKPFAFLSDLNFEFITLICKILEIKTKITWSSEYPINDEDSNLKLLSYCKKTGSNSYLSGPSAKAYIDLSVFDKNSITVSYYDYDNYPEYPQLFGPFVQNVSVLDLIFNTGASAKTYLQSNSSLFQRPIHRAV